MFVVSNTYASLTYFKAPAKYLYLSQSESSAKAANTMSNLIGMMCNYSLSHMDRPLTQMSPR